MSKDENWDEMEWDEEIGDFVNKNAKNTKNEEEVFVEPTLDINGTALQNGDSVQTIKDLDVKGLPVILKRGTKISGIKLDEFDTNLVECKVGKKGVYLKASFLRKA